MELMEWLRGHDARLDIHLTSELDPRERGVEWHCEIRGFLCPNGIRPAVFITEYPDGPESLVEAFAPDPRIALQSAIEKLGGLSVCIIGNGRDETHTFPDNLTA